MYQVLRDALARFRRDEGGNIFVLFGASAVPLLLIMGGAVDIARYERYKTALSNAVDAASLALAREGPDMDAAAAKTFITNYVSSFYTGDSQFSVQSFDVQKLTDGFQVSASGSMQTMFLPLGKLAKNGNGINSMDVNVVAQVVNASNRLEVALVMDNTGSMNCGATLALSCVNNWSAPASDSRIVAIKNAAKTLIDTVMPDSLEDKTQVKIAIVPFEGQVNVASAGFSVTAPPSWIDWSDSVSSTGPTWEGKNFGLRNTSTGATCTTYSSTCQYVGHKYLFNQLTAKFPTVKWAGCVEMRAGSYELSDAAPNTTIPDSLFVPFFHPDEPDSTATTTGTTQYNNRSNGTSSGTAYMYLNDYLKDQSAFTTPAAAQSSWVKYKNVAATGFWTVGGVSRMDVEGLVSPYEYGPNKGCPRPIYPLADANSKAALKSQIDAMIAYWSTGTFLPTGLVWGWHVLSPGIPYTEGTKPGDLYYDKTVKAIVFFTDGENEVSDDATYNPPGNPNKSRYSAYNYVNTSVSGPTYRLGSTAAASTDALNTKTATLCSNVKTNNTPSDTTDDIRVYVVTFGTISSTASTLMQNCASVDDGHALYYHAPTTSDLQDIFRQIGDDLNDIHLSM